MQNQKYSNAVAKLNASCAGLARAAGNARFYNTGVSKDAVRAAAADDEIAEALAERAERKGNADKA